MRHGIANTGISRSSPCSCNFVGMILSRMRAPRLRNWPKDAPKPRPHHVAFSGHLQVARAGIFRAAGQSRLRNSRTGNAASETPVDATQFKTATCPQPPRSSFLFLNFY